MIYTSLAFVAIVSAVRGDTYENLVNRIKNDPEGLAEELRNSELAALSPVFNNTAVRTGDGTGLPLVFLHGMGDSCFNRGMESITEESGEHMGVYSTCIPTGDTRMADTMNGFFLDMDSSVDVFAEKVKADAQLANGFNCVGLSQGNNICRGYIQRYNDPPVNTHLSIHGPLVGVAALPNCDLDGQRGDVCMSISELLGTMAYTKKMQDFLFQADYFRLPEDVPTDGYQAYSQMGKWNNEVSDVNADIIANFGKTNTFAMVKANGDTVVVPREGEWFGAYDTDNNILTMKETTWYKEDTFGLKTADEAGKVFFESTEGNHLDFTDAQLYKWLDTYCA